MQDQSTLVMGILNVTPDSFADGGRHFSLEDALIRAREMIVEGVDIIDVGGESTRPGAERTSVEEELSRVIPVISELRALGPLVSIDTMRSEVAQAAITAGAVIVNDVSGGLADAKMAKLIASNSAVQYVAMHWRGQSREMQSLATYKDVVREVRDELEERTIDLLKAGVDPEQIILDPGIGFAKTSAHNWEILRNIDRLQLLGYPLLVGVSRKRFLGELTNTSAPDDREAATIALTTELARQKVWAVRTHSVKAQKDAILVANELEL
ncbi:MAG: dihydropteroate synthase [Actinomycetes bacterium]|jgi:dihydropteroate synthase